MVSILHDEVNMRRNESGYGFTAIRGTAMIFFDIDLNAGTLYVFGLIPSNIHDLVTKVVHIVALTSDNVLLTANEKKKHIQTNNFCEV